MKTSLLIGIALTLPFFSSCNATTAKEKDIVLNKPEQIEKQVTNPTPRTNAKNLRTMNTQGKKQHPLKDQQGQVMGSFPIPHNWNESNQKDVYLESNDGVKVMDYVGNEFHYSQIPDYNQMLRENRQQVKPVKGLEQFIREDMAPHAQSQGVKFLSITNTPTLTNAFARQAQQFYNQGEQIRYDSAIAEFVDQNGAPTFVVVTYYLATGQYAQRWGYQVTGVEAPQAIYEQTKKDYLYAVINAKLDPQYVQRANQMSQQQAAQGYAAHRGRMDGIKAFGENNTRMFNARSAANDAQHASWRAGQQSSDRMQQQTINSINEVNTYTDGSGNNYQIPGYSKYVYINANGQYITTDDANYNPNADESAPGTWRKLEPQNNGGGY